MLTQINLTATNLALASAFVLVLSIAYYLVQYTRHELHIRRIGGVRAPILAGNPITGKRKYMSLVPFSSLHPMLQ